MPVSTGKNGLHSSSVQTRSLCEDLSGKQRKGCFKHYGTKSNEMLASRMIGEDVCTWARRSHVTQRLESQTPSSWDVSMPPCRS
ncbi:hypothetical protein AVEN_199669-1 [Araneus ventricosus]|uniref:Uncharacterized protein n=1 Tax=Araneus ventricosus TaxID=182803 RepID=A0A4Y2DHC1_ARAVE|nr:hypothetical protein AVEN_199669-1 [Araneus ventricosus]